MLAFHLIEQQLLCFFAYFLFMQYLSVLTVPQELQMVSHLVALWCAWRQRGVPGGAVLRLEAPWDAWRCRGAPGGALSRLEAPWCAWNHYGMYS